MPENVFFPKVIVKLADKRSCLKCQEEREKKVYLFYIIYTFKKDKS